MTDLCNGRPLVLLIDDDPKALDETNQTLSRAKLAARCCTTPDEAMTAARENPPDLIVANVNLHGTSGFEVCDRIKGLPGLGEVPIMFLSGSQLPDIIRRSYAAGGVYSLRKPFDPTVLLQLIDQALGVATGSDIT
jgi:CheY-like chemotaxis protein